MLNKIKQIWNKTDDVILRYPMVLTMALIASISAVVGITLDNEPNQFLVTKLAFVATLGISLMFGVKMLSQRIGKEFILEILATAFLIWFYFYLPKTQKDFTEIYAFAIIPLFILSHLFVSFSAFLDKNPQINFWQFNKNLFINIFLTAVFTGVLVGGVMLAILATDKLFDFNFDYRIYPKTFFLLGIFGSAFIFLMFDGSGLKHLEKDGTYPEILKFFTQFVLIPLLLIYAVILYFYSAKILLHWELPRGWVSYLVLAYSVVGILALLLVYPLKDDSTKSWVKVFSKIFYFTLLPLLVLLFVAIFTRILEYGYTEPRYYVLMLALWLACVVLYFIFFKKPNIKFIPISLFAFGVFALIFPYFNAFSVAKRSQKTELENILNENKLLVNGKIDFEKKISNEAIDEISDKFSFLYKRNEKEFLLSFISKEDSATFLPIFKEEQNGYAESNFKSLFRNSSSYREFIPNQRITSKNSEVVNISGYDYFIEFRNDNEIKRIVDGKQLIANNFYSANKNNDLTTIIFGESKYNLTPFLDQLFEKYKYQQRVELDEVSHQFDLEGYHFKIVFDEISKEKYSNENYNYSFENVYILIKKN